MVNMDKIILKERINKFDNIKGLVIILIIVGNLLIIFRPSYDLWKGIIIPIGILCGMFTGCFLLSLAEAVKGFPVFLRKSKIQKGISGIIILLALGKTLGSIFYFCCYLAGN